MQFINVIRELIDRGKQVLLLSHNGEWIKQVRTTCADLNGIYYEIHGLYGIWTYHYPIALGGSPASATDDSGTC
jgi:hypothetical protein